MSTASATVSTSALSRGQLKRLKAKKKASAAPAPDAAAPPAQTNGTDVAPASTPAPEIKEEEDDKSYVLDVPEVPEGFADVFAKFQVPAAEAEDDLTKPTNEKGDIIYSDDEMPSEDEEEEAVEMSKRKQKKLNRLSVAELKRLVKKPEVVDWVDVSATDPKLLVMIKSYRNTIPIPQHWSQKRDYLQGKRGVEKPQFQLPSFIADTGIATQQDAIKEKEEGASLKQKTRERVQPKMGKIDIDYQKLHDAFFKFQTKPKMTEFGELYYEGKEYETKLKEKKPGDISEELKEALSIPPLAPPPWLISMQRYGPPPSYPNLRIPGLSAPIPDGAAWGFHPGGWGKPPLDDYGRPLYGDIYGVNQAGEGALEAGEPVVKDPWGELEPDEEESEEEEESDEEDEDDEAPAPRGGLETPSGMDTPGGFASVSTVAQGLETPDFLELRKRREERDGTQTEEEDANRSLYTVIPEREARMRGFMGSDRAYDVSGITGQGAPVPVLGREDRGTKRKAGGVDVSLDANELEGLSESELRAKFEEAGRSARAGNQHEDLSAEVREEMAKRRKKEEAKKGGKKEKETFKF
ncbi:splicing factor 3B subunit 2 [Pseudohyphozyma bogoriensis]|nr:splicing factor 3B subunit 2 [Pseudohyphozyma bogoriensis]